MNSIDRYEIRASVFYQTTGYVAPGKDVSAAVSSESYEHNRQESWNDFQRVYGQVIGLTLDECAAELARLQTALEEAERERDEAKKGQPQCQNCDYHRSRKYVLMEENAALESQLTAADEQAERAEKLLQSAIERMNRARGILTSGGPSWSCNWGMLDTSDLLHPTQEPSDANNPKEPTP